MKICQALNHYYTKRGRSEIASFLQSWGAAFGVLFWLLTYTDLQALFSGEVEKDLTSLAIGFMFAVGRSALGGLAFAILKRFAPEKLKGRLEHLLLRTPDKK